METNNLYANNMNTTFYGRIMQDILAKDGFSANIIENYNNEISNKIPKIITSSKIPVANGDVTFENVRYRKPYEKIGGKDERLTPMMSRHKATPYFARIIADMVFTPTPIGKNLRGEDIYNPGDKPEKKEDIEIGSIPAMLGSDLCWLTDKSMNKEEERVLRMELGECCNDPLGYFIVKSERVIVIQENLRSSTFLLYPKDKSGPVEGTIVCPNSQGTTKVWINVTKHQCLRIILQHLKKPNYEGLPIFMLFKILGLTPEEAMERIYTFTKPEYRQRIYFQSLASLAEFAAIPVSTVEDCLEYVLTLRKKIDDKNIILLENILPNIHNDLFTNIPNVENKITHLAMYCAKMFEYMIGERTLDDRDSWSNKQLVTAGFQISKLFKTIWCDMINGYKRKTATLTGLKAVRDIYVSSKIGDNFVTAFGPNKWGLAKRKTGENITDSLKRATPIEVFAQITRVSFNVNRQSKALDLRLIHPSQLGYLCLYESPEGEGIGIVKNLATSCYISLDRDPEVIFHMLKDGALSLFVTENKESNIQVPLLVNGIIQAWCDPNVVMPELKRLRKEGVLHKDVCLFFNERDNTVEIYCDNGRPTRPLFVVDSDGQLLIEKKKLQNASVEVLIREGCIEYIDAREQEYIMVSQTYEHCKAAYTALALGEKAPMYTHCEIDPSAILSICASLMPMCNKNAGPRINFQAGMFRQSLGQYNSNEHNRFDAGYKMIHYPTKPLFQTDTQQMVGMNFMPTGQTAHIAILAHPDNPEDGIILKDEAVRYGNLLDMCKKQTIQSIASTKNSKEYIEEFERPSMVPGEPQARYAALDEQGLPKLDAYIRQGDCIVGKVRKFVKDGEVKNISEFTGIGGEGYVDRVLITMNASNQRVIRIKLRKNRKYTTGDKLCSRYSQKGTVARVIPARDLPRVKDGPNKGMVPDVIINPHSLPSRMTNNKIIEIKVSKAAAISGHFFNATTFRNFEDEMRYAEKTLSDYGLDMHGKENFILPNGNDLRMKIFFGPCHYQALRHHVADKIQMRARGGVKPETRQPVAGRNREGGLKVGEMERDALISHGSSALLRERLCDESDAYNLPICGTCGNIAITDHINGVYTCKVCGDKAKFGIIRIPYAIKLLLYYLNAAGVHMTFKTENMLGNIKRPEEAFLY
jgi:DNA-directed RNA polymerase beta subunit